MNQDGVLFVVYSDGDYHEAKINEKYVTYTDGKSIKLPKAFMPFYKNKAKLFEKEKEISEAATDIFADGKKWIDKEESIVKPEKREKIKNKKIEKEKLGSETENIDELLESNVSKLERERRKKRTEKIIFSILFIIAIIVVLLIVAFFLLNGIANIHPEVISPNWLSELLQDPRKTIDEIVNGLKFLKGVGAF